MGNANEALLKETFVTSELQKMLEEATGGYVERLAYEKLGPYEIVDVTTRQGVGEKLTFGVNVTGDSRWAIAKDVMKAVAEHYE